MPYYSKNTSPKVKVLKQELSYFPFSEYAKVPVSDLAALADTHQLYMYSSWICPQLLALFGTFKCFKNDEGKYEAMPFLEHNFGNDPFKQGIWKVAARLQRGKLIKGQNTPTNAHYSALVPLVLAGLKKFQNIKYSEWTRESIPLLVDSLLADAMLVPVDDIPELSNDRAIELRNIGLTTMSGATAGEVAGVTTKWKLSGLKDTEIGHLPVHTNTMLCQTWVAHPSLRNQYMVLNPIDWDDMPTPLVEGIIIKPQKAKTFVDLKNDTLPWYA